MKNNQGLIAAVGAYFWWGVIPIFWKQLNYVDALEIVMHRMVWSCILMIAFLSVLGQGKAFLSLFQDKALLRRMFVASLLMAINWAVFVWAVNTGKLVETSMGYFINPLISVVFGMLFFAERLRRGQIMAIVIAFVGVLSLIISYGKLPVVSLTLAITFSLYGVIKKAVKVPALQGLALETLFMIVPALLYLLYIGAAGQGTFGRDLSTDVLLILSGLFTLVPLALFAFAAKKISMTALGMTQYVGPFLQLGLGVLVYHEPFGSERMLAFSLVWIALVIYSIDQLNHQRVARRDRKASAR